LTKCGDMGSRSHSLTGRSQQVARIQIADSHTWLMKARAWRWPERESSMKQIKLLTMRSASLDRTRNTATNLRFSQTTENSQFDKAIVKKQANIWKRGRTSRRSTPSFAWQRRECSIWQGSIAMTATCDLRKNVQLLESKQAELLANATFCLEI